MTSLPKNPDVIVVGAGAAGLAAARTLMEGGVSVLVLEAAPIIGGRCITDTETFGLPFDRGASWMHSASINPLVPLAKQAGCSIHKTEWNYGRTLIEGHELDAAELASYSAYHTDMWAAAHSSPKDVAVSQVLPDSRWRSTTQHWISQYHSVDADQVSTQDVAQQEDGEGDWLVGGGLGNLIAKLASKVPVKLNCAVTAIDWTAPGVVVTTADGDIRAKHVIVTVSTGVLAAEKIKFSPPLPDERLEAIESLPMGLLQKIGILFDEDWKEAGEGYLADYHRKGEEFCSIEFGFFNTGLAIAFVSGRFAQQLESEGPGASTEFCMTGLKELFGNDVAKHIRKTDETAWMGHPLTLGAYSAALPGQAHQRAELAKPLDDRLFFAGEATIPRAYATVHGAHLSGIETAHEVLSLRVRQGLNQVSHG